MKHPYPKNYQKISDEKRFVAARHANKDKTDPVDEPLSAPARCPVSGNRIDPATAVRFPINGKHVTACSVECMKRIKEIYNLIHG
jgi:hypothetical protein